MAPLGIVNAVELTFAAMFVALLIWSLANYLHVSFGHIHMYMIPGEKVYVSRPIESFNQSEFSLVVHVILPMMHKHLDV